MLTDLIVKLTDKLALTKEQISSAVEALAAEHTPLESKVDFLLALSSKGETVEEIAAFAGFLREKSVAPQLDAETRARGILDVCGTGGDGLQTFNISTAVALMAAAADIPVAKHGNRAVTSQSGSADVLDALGIRTDLDPAEAGVWLRDHRFAFLFAPRYHPAFRNIGPARRRCAERGQRTIFNFLGPLLNPARPQAQLIGVPNPELCEPLARVLQSLGILRGMVVSGRTEQAPMDEWSTIGENAVADFSPERGLRMTAAFPLPFPIQPASLADLRGGDCRENAAILVRLLTGAERGPRREAVLLNAAAALQVGGRVRTLPEGWTLAEDLIDSGRAGAKLRELQSSSRG